MCVLQEFSENSLNDQETTGGVTSRGERWCDLLFKKISLAIDLKRDLGQG
jgi:hypothetical protein